MQQYSRLIVEIPDAQKKRLIKTAKKNGQPVAYIIRKLLDAWEKRQKT